MSCLIAAAICGLERPARTSSVRLIVMGRIERTAGGLKHSGPRMWGFQNSGNSYGDIHARSTAQTKPLCPLTAVA